MSPTLVAAALRKPGATLNPGRPDFDASGLAPLGLGPLHPGFVATVRSFDGFAEWDEATLFTMWSVEMILAGQQGFARSVDHIAFGDCSIDADFILCDPCDAARPVLLSGGLELAPDYEAFWERLMFGVFEARRHRS